MHFIQEKYSNSFKKTEAICKIRPMIVHVFKGKEKLADILNIHTDEAKKILQSFLGMHF